jgi:hypothetical protein
MPLAEKEQSLMDLGAHVFGIRGALMRAWQTYMGKTPAELHSLHDATARANCVHCYIKHEISLYAQLHPARLRVIVINKLFILIVDEKYAIRFKKLDDELNTANHPTGQVLSFKNQEEIDGVPVLHFLETGYMLDESELNISMIYLLCPNGPKKYYWEAKIEHEKVLESGPVIHDFFANRTPVSSDADDDGLKVKAKPSADVAKLVVDSDSDKG